MIGKRLAQWVLVASLLGFGAASPAQAAWKEVSSQHFVIISENRPEELVELSRRLENYHAAMAKMFNLAVSDPGAANRVTIYDTGAAQFKKLVGKDGKSIAGYYVPRAGRSVAFMPRIGLGTAGKLESDEVVMLHEYAHHFMASHFTAAYPWWMTEGFAEFAAATTFERDGSMYVGRPNDLRAYDIATTSPISVETLLATQSTAGMTTGVGSAFYGRAWMLFHYLTFAPEVRGQLANYQRAMAAGESPLVAGRTSFGDLAAMTKALDAYSKRRRLTALNFKRDQFPVQSATVRVMTAGESAMMPVHIQSISGVDDATAATLVVQARALAAPYPNDAGAQAALAEAEYDGGNDDAAIAAADRAISAQPNHVNALMQKGYALMRKREKADKTDIASWRIAIAPFQQANRADPDNPLPMVELFEAQVKQNGRPSANTIAALEYAYGLARFDTGIQWSLAQAYRSTGKRAEAIALFRRLAVHPHDRRLASMAKNELQEMNAAEPNAAPSAPAMNPTPSPVPKS